MTISSRSSWHRRKYTPILWWEDLYPTVEEKAAHLLYFMVKDHPFTDGNKRSGAFAFIWYLQKSGLLNPLHITPETLTALTL